MASGRDRPLNDDEPERGVLSDESSFYGDDATKAELEESVASFDPESYWTEVHPRSLATIQYSTSKRRTSSKPRPLKETRRTTSPYGAAEAARLSSPDQLTDFLTQFPPSTCKQKDIGPWIWAHNPQSPPSHKRTGDIAQLQREGTRLLHDFEDEKASLEASFSSSSSSSSSKPSSKVGLARKLNTLRRALERDLFALMKRTGVTAGKWMLFPSQRDVDELWAAVAAATVKGQLGVSAKVATATEADDASESGSKSGRARLICVYTYDFEDTEDVRRVLVQMRDMGLVSEGERPIYYKCDGYTYLEISSNNPYGLKASMFSSRDTLSGKS